MISIMTNYTYRMLSAALRSAPLSLLFLSACGGSDLTNGQAAIIVVGQANFVSSGTGSGAAGLNGPYGNVYTDGEKLYIPDKGNNRVLVFNSIPTTNGPNASYALGQPDMTTYASGTSATTMYYPSGTVISGNKLFVADFFNSRIAIYNSVPAGSPGIMDVVAGQIDKTSRGGTCSATGLYYPGSVSVAGSKMVVADSQNNRVLIWNSIPTADGTPADLVLGQTNMTSCVGGAVSASTINFPTGVWTDGTRLVVLDFAYNRVLIWNSFPTSNGQAADLVVGQPNFTSSASGTTATTLNQPYEGVFVDVAGKLYVADSQNNRVLIWNSFPTSNGQAADRVLGQPNFTSNTPGTTAAKLYFPNGVYASGNHVFVTDGVNNRVLIY